VLAKAQSTAIYQDEKYGYDGLDRLQTLDRGQLSGGSITNKQFAQDWHLDPTGNWSTFKQDDDGNNTWDLNQTRTHNEVNELTAISGGGWVTPTHDRTGNLTTMPRPASLTNPYYGTYDAWNRLVKVTDGTNTVAEYAYDGVNRRTVKKTYTSGSLSETRDFYYSDQWQVIEERVTISSVRTLERQFIWGLRYIDDLILREVFDTSSGSLLNRRYSCQDANFNVVAITDTSGGVTQRFAYDSYGVSKAQDAAFVSATNTEWETRYAGYRWDAETGLYQVRMRYLHSHLGRWITRDRISLLDDQNTYTYCFSASLTVRDPFGLSPKCCGPDVTKWLHDEMTLFSNAINNYVNTRIQPVYPYGESLPFVEDTEGAAIANSVIEMLKTPHALWTTAYLQQYANYKPASKDPDDTVMQVAYCPTIPDCRNTVTLCGVCMPANQLGNIVLGVMAEQLDVVSEARAYGRKQWTFWNTVAWLSGRRGPDDDWNQFPYKEVGFDVGISYARGGVSLCSLIEIAGENVSQPKQLSCSPCSLVYNGPHSVIGGTPKIHKSGNRR